MRNKIKQKNEINLFCLLKVSHLLIYILVSIFFKFKHQNSREKEKNKRPSHPPLPPLQNLNWSLHVQNKKSIFTENKNKNQTNNLKELGSEWAGDLRVKRKESWPRGGTWDLASQSPGKPEGFPCAEGTPHQGSCDHHPQPEWLREGCGSATAAQATVCVYSVSPLHTPAQTHTHTHSHTWTCFCHCG